MSLTIADYWRIYSVHGIARVKDEILENFFYDFVRNVDTQKRKTLDEYVRVETYKLSDSVQYQPVYTSILRESLGVACSIIGRPRLFVDFGSGKGKVILEAAKYHFDKIIGIEIDAQLNEVAVRNLETYRGKLLSKTRVTFVEGAAEEYRPESGATIVFFFNPFGEDTMWKVVRKLEEMSSRSEVPVVAIYVNPMFEKVFEGWTLVRKKEKFMQSVNIYRFG